MQVELQGNKAIGAKGRQRRLADQLLEVDAAEPPNRLPKPE
jgi:hypothetical protein